MKILILYAGIEGNRELYHNDTVVVGEPDSEDNLLVDQPNRYGSHTR